MNAREFRQLLARKLKEQGGKPLLRIALSERLMDPIELTGAEIVERAEALTDRHLAAEPGGVTLLLLPHSPELFLLHFGMILRGRLPAILPWPTSRIDPEKYQRNLLHQLRNLPASQLVTLPRLAANMGPWLPFPATACPIEGSTVYEESFRPLAQPEDSAGGRHAGGEAGRPSDTAVFLQFSGGTTGYPEIGCRDCPHAAGADGPSARRARLRQPGQRGFMATLYHDMGLIACLWFPLWHGASSLQFSAGDWLMKPDLLFYYADRYRGTFCWLPNFAFSYLANQRERMQGPYDVSSMRAWINCSEPVRLRSMNCFTEVFRDWGVRAESTQASYAMAETVFAVTQTGLEEPPRCYPRAQVRERSAALQELAFDVIDDVYVSSGRLLEGTEVRIVDAGGQLCEEARPGEIQIRSESLFSGYWGAGGFATGSLSGDGWYSSGDYGFRAGDELYVIGRLKDIVIVGGQNVFPEDVELVVNTVREIYPGRVVAFGVLMNSTRPKAWPSVAELRGEYNRKIAKAIERQIQQLVLASIGVAARFVRVVPERWIVKSTAGKISRRDTRARLLQEMNRTDAR